MAVRRIHRWTLAAGSALLLLLAAFGLVLHEGSILCAPRLGPVGSPPEDLPAAAVVFPSESGSQLHGWFVEGRPELGGVILLHGLRADRRSMVGRARFLYGRGYSVLLFDLQAHGESVGERITFGHLESQDARAAVGFMRSRLPGRPLAAIGTSLGGAACVLARPPLDVNALVLEAVFPDVRRAVLNRLRIRFGPAAPLLSPFLIEQIEPRLGIHPDDLSPVRSIRSIHAPVLIIAGGADRRTTLADADDLFVAAPMPKRLWVLPGAGHVDFHRFAPGKYEQRVLRFLGEHMGGSG